MFHQEADGVATAATAKAFVYFFCRRNRKRWRFLIVKRTKAEVVGSSFLQLHKATDHIDDIKPAKDLLYGVLRDQGSAI